jgi:hypothetical protein
MKTSQALHVAAKLNVADHLSRKPMKASELATATGTDPAALHRLMRALCALGVFAESSGGEFSLNPAAEMLRSDVPGSFRAAVLFLVGDVRWRCWADLLGAVRKGVGGAEGALGMELFEFYAAHPEESEIHDQAMRAMSAAQIRAVLEAFDFAQAGTVVDVGGGTGELLAAILAANPSLRGVLFDLPHVVAQATPTLTDHGVADRVQGHRWQLFRDCPNWRKHISEDDTRSTTILRNCRKAMTSGDRLIILDRQLPELGQPGTPEIFLVDLEMLVMSDGGRERTREEFAKLLSDTAFKLARTVSTNSPFSIFEAHPT